MSEIFKPKRVGYDVDDTLVQRETVTRFGGFVKGRMSPLHLPSYLAEALPELDHTPRELERGDRAAFYFHHRRKAIPGVPAKLNERHRGGIEQFAISGRPADLKWHNATSDQLTREGYPIPKDRVILTPEGIKGVISKAVAIRTLDIEEFSDDDLKTQLILSGLFPERRFNWIKWGLTNYRVDEVVMAARPNLQPVPIAEWRGIR